VVVGIDVNPKANELALDAGASLVVDPRDPEWKRRVADFTGKQGVDATIICASSDSAEIVNASMEITRRQGRVVIVGYVKLDIHPKNFLYNEIDLRYSRAYGPGSYHAGYEKGRLDYPFGYVRWTEQRNLGELIRLLATGAVDLEPLIAGVYDLDDVQSAFDAIQQGTLGGVAAVIRYRDEEPERKATLPVHPRPGKDGTVGISLVGFGNHALAQHLPNLRAMKGVELRGIASATGRNAAALADKIDATIVTTDIEAVLADPDTDGVVISTAQPEHYDNLRQAIEADKAILIEKPLVTRLDQFQDILRRMESKRLLVTVGLNRRYSPMIRRLRDAVEGDIDSVTYTVTRPYLPPEHWSLDPIDGGGRLISEGEHFVDLCNLLTGQTPVSVYAHALGTEPEDLRTLCNYAVTIHYERAVANITFDESGSADFPTERITVLAKGQVATLDDFSNLTVHGRRVRKLGDGLGASMGHKEQLQEFVAAIRGEPNSLLGWDGACLATLTVFAAQESIRTGQAINLEAFRAELLGGASEPESVPV